MVTDCLKTQLHKVITDYPDSKVHGANMGPIWGRQDPGGPHVDTMNLAIWVVLTSAGDPNLLLYEMA